MKTLINSLLFILVLNQSIAQNTFWIVKGGSGNEAGNYYDALLDTTDSGNLVWVYNTTSTANGNSSIVMEKWERDSTSAYSELILGSSSSELLHGFEIYEDEMFILGRAISPSIASGSRPYIVRADTNGNVLATFLSHNTSLNPYSAYYEPFFVQDTLYAIGIGRSSGQEDYLISRFDLSADTMVFSKTYNGGGTERLLDIESNNRGDTLYATSYRPGGYPALFLFDRDGGLIDAFYYTGGPASSHFFRMAKIQADSLTILGRYSIDRIHITKLGPDGSFGWAKSYAGSPGSVFSLFGFQTHHDTMYIYGKIDNEITGMGGEEGVLIATDTLGNVYWSKLYGGSGDENIIDIQFIPGGMYLTGYTTTSSQGGKDVFLIKADANGNATFNSTCFNITPFTATLQTNNFSFTRNNFSPSFSGNLSNHQHAISTAPSTGIMEDNCSPLNTSVEEKFEEMYEYAFGLFPNPFADYINVSLPESTTGRLKLSLSDEMGRLVMQTEYLIDHQGEIQWSVPGLAKGIYIVQATLLHDGKLSRFRQKVVRK
ncbi:MAG: T9SS type A sorting domain-containing protein [Bacteroidia bacterium]